MGNLDEINAYCESHTTSQAEVLHQLERATHLKTLSPQMLSGHLQGTLLRFISRMLRPRIILEIGTFTGYAAICLAEGLVEGGVLHTIDPNHEIKHISDEYFAKAGVQDKIIAHLGKAEEIIPKLNLIFDLVFIDAGKLEYGLFYDLVIDKVRPGGIILADNTLWSGKVLLPEKDTDTKAIDDFNKKIQNDERVENVLLPIRDGLMMMRKI
ncbi:MAG: O-methyltransferase [Saprospiraceae bacterium]|nr:O-methyltransferase [Saprospiraceae bacterium]MCB9324797.1 O-methyltransferase [Lewinellaceae bacterium]